MKKRTRPNVPFSKILNALMADKGLGVREAARIAGVGSSTLMSWKAGALPENYIAVKRLANALGTSFSYLLTGENDERDGSPPPVAEVFNDGGAIFDGYAKITIQRLIPRSKKEKNGNEK